MATWLLLGLMAASGLSAQDDATSSEISPNDTAETAQDASEQDRQDEQDLSFLESITVTATLSERTLAETPGQIDLVSKRDIERLGFTRPEDLVTFAPGVYLDGDLTRLGTSGFNIRGVGGNRVLTEIDGIPTAEQFQFGPFQVNQYSLDLDTLESVEIVRSAGSALYGSDALGGVVSLVTRSPRSLLGDRNRVIGLRGGFDSRAEEGSVGVSAAVGNETWQASLQYTRRDGSELDNQGDVATSDFTRTEPNPIDREQDNALLKVGRNGGNGSYLEGTFEWFDSEARTQVLSGQRPATPFGSAVLDLDALDTQERQRLSVEHSLLPSGWLADSLIWRAFWQQADTEQFTDEIRLPSVGQSQRDGLLTFDQRILGLEAELRKSLDRRGRQSLTYGFSLRNDRFDQLRDRTELVIATGAPVPTSLAFPTKYFPESDVEELGVFVQGELELIDGRLRLIPGLRYDRYDLDADQSDAIFLSGNPGTGLPVDLTETSVSPKLGLVYSLTQELSVFAQYAAGFRAPPMSAVNNGFTNQGGGYRTLANPDLEAETSDNFELGLRGSFDRGGFSIVAFDNRYDDFIETVSLGFNPALFLVEFQPRNLSEVEISGVEISGDLRIGKSWFLRTAYSYTEGDDLTAGEPLESIHPATWVNGVRYQAPGSRWGLQGILTLVDSKDNSDLPSGSTQFQTPSYETLDLAAWFAINQRIRLQATAWNLSDETYWRWPYVRGQSQTSSTIDRYTSPGRSFGLQARFEL